MPLKVCKEATDSSRTDTPSMCQYGNKNKFYFCCKYPNHIALLTPCVVYSKILIGQT